MKKYLVSIVVLFLIGGMSMQAQTKFALKAGVNLSNVSLDQKLDNFKSENLTGFQVGPMLEFMTPLGLGLDLSVLYSQQGFKLSHGNHANEYKLNTLDIPLNLKLKLGLVPGLLKAYGTAGPYINLKLSDKLINQVEAQSFGAGLNFGFGVELLKHLQIGANYQWGLTNNYSNFNLDWWTLTDLKGRPTMWSVTAAYLF